MLTPRVEFLTSAELPSGDLPLGRRAEGAVEEAPFESATCLVDSRAFRGRLRWKANPPKRMTARRMNRDERSMLAEELPRHSVALIVFTCSGYEYRHERVRVGEVW